MPQIRPNHIGFQKLKASGFAATDRAIAERFSVDPATLSRFLQGKTEPHSRLIAGAISALGVEWFGDLFKVVD